MENKKSNRNCPVCNFNSAEKLTAFDYSDTMSLQLPLKQDLVCCEKCGCVYIDTTANQKDFDLYYKSLSSYDMDYSLSGKEVPEQTINFQAIVDYVSPFINEKSEIIEIGCAKGYLCKSFINNGFKNIQAVEPSTGCCKIAENSGIKVTNGNCFIEKNEFCDNFDLIILSHVAEHIFDFDKAMKNLKKMLKKDAFILIEVPNADTYVNGSEKLTPYYFFNYEHINHFSISAFENIARIYGFEIVKSENLTDEFGYMSLRLLLKNKQNKEEAVSFCSDTKTYITDYLKSCEKRTFKPEILEFEKTQEPLILWGIGSTTTLFLSNAFKKCNVVGIVDINEKKQGQVVKLTEKSFTILSPEILANEKATVIILPKLYQQEISEMLKKINNKLKGICI